MKINIKRWNSIPLLLISNLIMCLLFDVMWGYRDIERKRQFHFYAESYAFPKNKMEIKGVTAEIGKVAEVTVVPKSLKEAFYLRSLTNRSISETTNLLLFSVCIVLFWALPGSKEPTIFTPRFLKGLQFIGALFLVYVVIGSLLQNSIDNFYIKSLTRGEFRAIDESEHSNLFIILIYLAVPIFFWLNKSITHTEKIEKEQELII